MHPYPHPYTVQAAAAASDNVTLESPGLPALAAAAQATRRLEQAEHACLISNSLAGQRHLHPHVIVG